eukprot:1026985-Heterocapsa_arctica.AAC.1
MLWKSQPMFTAMHWVPQQCVSLQVPLLAATTFLVNKVFVEHNWDDKQAYVTDAEEDIHQKIHKLFVKTKLLDFTSAKQLAKGDKFKQQVDEAEEACTKAEKTPAGQQAAENDASAEGLSGKKRRKLGKRLSDVE